jgi:NAD(P)-dependent dehydrogenase (short-subunit alcohol dehydrogenase family)
LFQPVQRLKASLAEWGMSAFTSVDSDYPAVDMRDKYVLLTGATSGIGEACAHALARKGARLTLLCRNRAKAERVQAEIASASGRRDVALLIADLSVQAEVRRAAADYLATGKPLHVLINNAGALNAARKLTVDGIEQTFATNHLAYFLLTRLLLERIEASAPARIVNVSSWGHNQVKDMGFDDINGERAYETFQIYGRSKLGNLLFTRELAARLRGKNISVNALHPGAVATGLGTQNGRRWSVPLAALKRLPNILQTPEQGAATTLYVATAAALDGVSGQYFVNCAQAKPQAPALDDAAAKRLWELSESLTGLC